jgi:archaellum biogenesis ATPase FlaH
MSFRRHTKCDNCGSSDGRAVYQDGGEHCFVCGFTILSEDYKNSLSEQKNKPSRVRSFDSGKVFKQYKDEGGSLSEKTKPAMTQEEYQEIKSYTSSSCNEYRGIRDDVCSYFGVRVAYGEAEEDGQPDPVLYRFYPCTQEGKLVGLKRREHPKTFVSIGRTGADCELFMQFRFTRPGKYLLITEGEEDALAAYQMLSDYNKSKGWDYETAVVSATTGANSYKQIAAQYEFINKYENVILSYDNDAAGKDAVEKLLGVLPKGKVKVMQMRHKDANEYLLKGDVRNFINDFYDAEKPVPSGVLSSDCLYDELLKQVGTAKVPFPDFFGEIDKFLPGGMPLGHIINIAAPTSVGKTTLVNELIYFWIYESPHQVGVVSMELDSGQYAEALLSRHLQKKLSLIADEDEKLAYLQRKDVQQKAQELFRKENGDPRFYLLDNRDASVSEIQQTIEQLVISCDCKVIVVDVLQDIIAALSIEEQEQFMSWCKGMIKSHKILLILINHTRKGKNGDEGSAHDENNIHGSSSIVKSASLNVILRRDKMHEDPVVRNQTEIYIPKNRIYGLTGSAGLIYYDNDTHTLHSWEKFLKQKPENVR